KELRESLSYEKEENKMLKELLEKYSLTVEDLTAKGIKFDEISEDELEAKIIEVFEIDVNGSNNCDKCDGDCDGSCEEDNADDTEGQGEGDDIEGKDDNADFEGNEGDNGDNDDEGDVEGDDNE